MTRRARLPAFALPDSECPGLEPRVIQSSRLEGERDLARLLAELDPVLDRERYSFTPTAEPKLPSDAFALVREAEGLTLIQPDPAGDWARISLAVHSSLEAIGLTAALTSRLANSGISANVVAGLNHDHFFVPWDRREEALGLLACSHS